MAQAPFQFFEGGDGDEVSYGADRFESDQRVGVSVGYRTEFGRKNGILRKTAITGLNSVQMRYALANHDIVFYDVHVTSDDRVLVTGSIASNEFEGDLLVVLLDQSGTIIWQKKWSSVRDEKGLGVSSHDLPSGDKVFAVCGVSTNENNDKDGFWMILDEDGDVLYDGLIAGGGDEQLKAVAQSDSGFVIVGQTASLGPNEDALVVEINPEGKVIGGVVVDHGGDDKYNGVSFSRLPSASSLFYMVGETNSFQANTDILMGGYNVEDKSIAYTGYVDGTEDEIGYNVFGNGGLSVSYVASRTDSEGNTDAILYTTDVGGLGNNEGSTLVGNCSGDEVFYDVTHLAVGFFDRATPYVVGSTTSMGTGDHDFLDLGFEFEFGGSNASFCMGSMYNETPTSSLRVEQDIVNTGLLVDLDPGRFVSSDPGVVSSSVSFTSNDLCSAVAPCDISIAEDDTLFVCDEGSVELSVDEYCATYSWSTGAITSQISVSNPGQYIVDVSGSCSGSDTVVVEFVSSPSVDLGVDQVYDGLEVALDAGPGFDSYSWSTGDQTQGTFVNVPGVYSVVVSDGGCFGQDIIEFTSQAVVGKLASSYTWNRREAMNDTLATLDSTKAYVLRVAGHFSDDAGLAGTYSDAAFSLDHLTNTSTGVTAPYWTNHSAISRPDIDAYTTDHIYNYTFCGESGPLDLTYNSGTLFDDGGVMTFDLYELGEHVDADTISIETTGGCAGVETSFALSNGDFTSYQWNFGDSLAVGNTSTNASPVYSYPDTGTYTVGVIVTSFCGEVDTVLGSVEVAAAPAVDIVDQDICDLSQVILEGGDSSMVTVWSTGDSSETLEITQSGTYSVIVNTGNCLLLDTARINMPAREVTSKRGNVWYFGNNKGLDFNSGVVGLSDGAMAQQEGCASIADEDGALLFYTDGVSVFNRDHQVMSNGAGLLGELSSSQSAIIIPWVGQQGLYAVITAPDRLGTNDVAYSIVDMSLDGGNGAITVKNQSLLTDADEKITAVPMSSADGYWVIAHKSASNEFHAFPFLEDGTVGPVQVSAVGKVYTDANDKIGYLKGSHQLNRVAMSVYGTRRVELFRFDNQSGLLSDPIEIANAGFANCYGLEFSPSGSKLYVSMIDAVDEIFQMDVSDYDSTAINNSVTLVGQSLGTSSGALQLGPDGRIYEAGIANGFAAKAALGVINNPEEEAANVDYVPFGFQIVPSGVMWGLPNMPAGFMIAMGNQIESSLSCLPDSSSFELQIPVNSVTWDFGDAGSGSNSSNLLSPAHLFSDTGAYQVQAFYTTLCGVQDTVSTSVTVGTLPIFTLPDSSLCGVSSFEITSGIEGVHAWVGGNSNDTVQITSSGNYILTVTNGTCSYTDTASIVMAGVGDGELVDYNTWIFGANAGIDFAGGVATTEFSPSSFFGATTNITLNGTTYYSTGSAVQDETGAILIGGSPLEGFSGHVAPALLYPLGTTQDSVGLITIDAGSKATNYVIDVSSGTPIVVNNGAFIFDAEGKVGGFRSADGTLWLAMHSTNATGKLYAMKMGDDGNVDLVITSNSQLLTSSSPGTIVFSKDGTKLAVVSTSGVGAVEVFDFDPVGGGATNSTLLSFGSLRGAEFSPDGTKLYVTGTTLNSLTQYDLTATNPENTGTLVSGTFGSQLMYYPVLGPDEKIYIGRGSGTMVIIENPDADASSLTLSEFAIAGDAQAGHVNYVRDQLVSGGVQLSIAGACLGDSVNASLSAQVINPVWTMGDGVGTSVAQGFNYMYSDTGSFEVKVVYENTCQGQDSLTRNIEILPVPIVEISDTSVCGESMVTITAPSGFDSYVWSQGSLDSVVNISVSGQNTLTVTMDGCTAIDTFNVTIADDGSTGTGVGPKNQFNVWYFGEGAGLDFSTTPPTMLTDGAVDTWEGVASISDENGDLLFYTDGSNVWNRDHDLMPNGTSLKGDKSATQSGIIVPDNTNPDRYLLFTVPSQESGASQGFNYSVVDMSLDGGKGDVSNKNILLFTPSSEKVTAVLHEDGSTVWVIGHKSNSNEFMAYPVANGVVGAPVSTFVGRTFGFGVDYIGYLKASPDGTKLAMAFADGYQILDFDASTGVVSNAVGLSSINNRAYGVEFSPNSRYLYVSDYRSTRILQYDMLAGNSQQIAASSVVVVDGGNNKSGMQIGPDGRIYVGAYDETNVEIIENPDSPGASVVVDLVGYDYDPVDVHQGFPPFITSIFDPNYSVGGEDPDITANDVCIGDRTFVAVNDATYTILSWDIGDPTTTSDVLGPEDAWQYTYPEPGNFTAVMSYIGGCEDTLTENVPIAVHDLPERTHTDSVVCGFAMQLTAPTYAQYAWYDATAPTALLGTQQTFFANITGDFFVVVSDVNGCEDTSTYNVLLDSPVYYDQIAEHYYFCPDDGDTVLLDLGAVSFSYIWHDSGLENAPLTVTEAGDYEISAYGDTLCETRRTIQVHEECEPVIFVPKAFTPNGDGLNEEFTIFTSFLSSYHMLIFNQWGETIFESTDVNVHWDGTYLDELVNTGAFAWKCEYGGTFGGEEKKFELHGDVTVIR